jgi:type I restriction enzyme S subunit
MIKELILEKNSLPVGWELKNLLEVSNVLTGKHNANHSKKDGKYRFYTCAYEHLFCDTKKFKGECLIFPGNGANVGEVFYFDGEFDAYQRTYVIFDIKINARYLHYHMLLYWRELGTKLQYGSATNFIKIGNFQDYEVSVPPKNQQKQIVDTLDKAFAAIDTAKANAEQNLQNAKELFESYLQNVFENKGDDWEEKRLDEVCEITSKLIDPKESQYQELIHIGAGNIVSEKGTLVDLKTAKEENLISGKFLFDESMVLYSKIRPYLMKIVKCNFKGLCSADIYPLVPFNDKMTQSFLYHLLSSYIFTEYAIEGSQRAGMPKVNRKHLFAYSFYCPTMEEQKQIVNKLDTLSSETKKLEAIYTQKIADLEEMKKSVLQKAFSGQLNTIN